MLGYSGPKVQSFLFFAPLFSQTNGAEKRTNGAEKRTNGAEKRTKFNGAEKRTNGAEKRTNGAEKRTNGAEKRKCTLGPPYLVDVYGCLLWEECLWLFIVGGMFMAVYCGRNTEIRKGGTTRIG